MNSPQPPSGAKEKEIFLEALEKAAPDERAAYLNAACGQDLAVRAAVEDLLRNHLKEPFLEQPATLIASAAEAQRRQAAPAGDPFPPGELFGDRYRIVGLLGEGGMGKVYRADDLKLGQSVALKFLPLAFATDPVWLLRFRNEVRVAREVAHPNVCRVYDIGEAEGEHFISMEFVDGEDLASLLRRIGRLPQDKAVDIARQLCAGLAAAHARGVVHRDLKPANIMIDGRGKVRITDFGIAALAGQAQGKEVRAGTPSYMAPEQLASSEVTPRSDIYSLGLVLYEVFTGKKAIDGTSITQIERAHSRGAPATPASHVRDLDPQVERIILRCVEPDPKNRPRSAMAVAAALPGTDLLAEAIAAGDTPSPELLAEAGESGSLRPWQAFAGWLGVVAALAGVLAIKDRTTLLRFIPPIKPPEVLAERAEQILKRLGHTNAPADKAFWFARDRDALRYLTNTPAASDRLKQLASGRPAPLVFRYRSSPRGMKPVDPESRVTETDPPLTEPGMRRVTLDAQGRLLGFIFVPWRTQAAGDSSQDADWSAPFAEAELQVTNFTRVVVNRTPEVYCDRVAAWTGAYPGWPGETLRVEAGSVAGQPVFFWLIGPWRDALAKSPGKSNADESAFSRFMKMIVYAIVLVVLGTAVFLARRNLLTGRGDRAGARRLGICVFLISIGEFVCTAHSVGWNSIFEALLPKVGGGFLAWVFYLGIEPYARRYWPHTLVSWSRLWSGRLRDPSVGRDVLIGCLAGLVWLLLEAVEFAPKGWTGKDPSDPYMTGSLGLLLGGRHVAGEILGLFGSGMVVFLMGFFLFLLLVRILVRRDWVMIAVVFIGFLGVAVASMGESRSWLDWILTFAYGAIWIIVPVRFGLLALIVMVVSWNDLFDLLPLDFSAWWSGAAMIIPVLLLTVASYGCWVSMAGKPLFKDEILAK